MNIKVEKKTTSIRITVEQKLKLIQLRKEFVNREIFDTVSVNQLIYLIINFLLQTDFKQFIKEDISFDLLEPIPSKSLKLIILGKNIRQNLESLFDKIATFPFIIDKKNHVCKLIYGETTQPLSPFMDFQFIQKIQIIFGLFKLGIENENQKYLKIILYEVLKEYI